MNSQFHIACYLINHMLSSVLDGQITYLVLCLQTDLFPLPPKVFGCVCFIHNNNPHRTKLNLYALKSVFEYSHI